MTEPKEHQFRSYEEARAALNLGLDQIDPAHPKSFDVDKLFAIAEQCILLLTTSDPASKDVLAGQQSNLLRDFHAAKIGLKGELLGASSPEKKTEIIQNAKARLITALDVLSRKQKM